MKLKNKQNNNYFEIDETIMRGSIEMTRTEWADVYTFLSNEYKKAKKNIDTYTRDSLNSTLHIITRDIFKTIFNLGVCATTLIVKKYNLKNYKDVNYAIIIKK